MSDLGRELHETLETIRIIAEATKKNSEAIIYLSARVAAMEAAVKRG